MAFHKIYCCQGFILVVMLLFSLMISLLCMVSLMLETNETKLLTAQNELTYLFLTADTNISAITSQLQTGQVLPLLPFQPSIPSDLTWWQSHGLIMSSWYPEIYSRAVIEQWHAAPCLTIFGAKEAGVNFYRITVIAAYNARQDKLILQTIYALPALNISNCKQIRQTIQPGLQSWHRLF